MHGLFESDLLSEALERVRMRGFVSPRNEYTAPWGVHMSANFDDIPIAKRPKKPPVPWDEPSHHLPGTIYVITLGRCWLEVEGQAEPIRLKQGDLVLLPRGTSHTLRDDLHTRPRQLWELLPEDPNKYPEGIRYGGGGVMTRIFFGGFWVEDRDRVRLLGALPDVIHVSCTEVNDTSAVPCLKDLVSMLDYETAEGRPGGLSAINHLMYILFIQAVRCFVANLPEAEGNWLGAILDPEVGPAVAKIHSRPDAPWTVASLADTVAMSRSAFAQKFTKLIGEPPLAYLTKLRMQRASELLRDGRVGMKEIAAKIGYDSEAAFSTAFKRMHGISPGIYRKQEKVMAAR